MVSELKEATKLRLFQFRNKREEKREIINKE
jgi:hypothetical protein